MQRWQVLGHKLSLLLPRSYHTLRTYQQECIQASLQEFSNGIRRQVVCLPVGSGKTVIFANLISHIPDPTPDATRTLVLAHRGELLEQAGRHIHKANPSLRIVRDQASKVVTAEGIRNSDVVLASVQTLGREGSRRLDPYDPSLFKYEAHHAVSSQFSRIFQRLGINDMNSHIFLWGCSATLRRHDGVGLFKVFDKIVYERKFLTMIEESHLCKFHKISVKQPYDPNESDDDRRGRISGLALAAWNKYSASEVEIGKETLSSRKRCLIFAESVNHIESMVRLFQKHGLAARGIHSDMRRTDREEVLDDFSTGRVDVLINCGVLTEGVDIPAIDCVILARHTKSSSLFIQMIGRGLRHHQYGNDSRKEDCLIVDLTNCWSDESLSSSFPTLGGIEIDGQKSEGPSYSKIPNMSVDHFFKSLAPSDEDQDAADEKRAHNQEKIPFLLRVTSLSYKDLFKESRQSKGIHLSPRLNRLAWIQAGRNSIFIKISSKEYVLITDVSGTSNDPNICFTSNLICLDPPSSSEICQGDTLDSIVRASETYIVHRDWRNRTLLARNANWRKQPASMKQMELLGNLKMDWGDKNINKGEATDRISRHLFRLHLKKLEAEETKGGKRKRGKGRGGMGGML
ncbi:hypothetical protein HDU97_006904 [Phlyctochytrium planicorne]|nr:hypothetical protein HDU97_006904 [Phlyctochytrium planicorne]